jgi:hypothetical protein
MCILDGGQFFSNACTGLYFREIVVFLDDCTTEILSTIDSGYMLEICLIIIHRSCHA